MRPTILKPALSARRRFSCIGCHHAGRVSQVYRGKTVSLERPASRSVKVSTSERSPNGHLRFSSVSKSATRNFHGRHLHRRRDHFRGLAFEPLQSPDRFLPDKAIDFNRRGPARAVKLRPDHHAGRNHPRCKKRHQVHRAPQWTNAIAKPRVREKRASTSDEERKGTRENPASPA